MDDKALTIQRWIVKAERDLLTAQTMLARENPPTDIVCFHAQQCAEKALKAYLVSVDQDFPKIHDLLKLLELCVRHDPELRSLEEGALTLADYAVETRYVDDWRDIPLTEAREAVPRAERILAILVGRLPS